MNRGGTLGSISALFDDMEQVNEAHTLLCVAELKGIPDLRVVRERVTNLSYVFPTFSSVVEERAGVVSPYKAWVHKEIDCERHIEIFDHATFKKSSFGALLTRILNTAFESDIPRWKFHFVRYPKSDKSFFVVKISHVYGDGAMISHIFRSLCDGRPKSKEVPKRRGHSSFLYKIYALIAIALVIVRHLFSRLASRKSRIDVDRGDTRAVSYEEIMRWRLSDVRKIAKDKGVSINDVVHALLFRAVAMYDGKSETLSSLSIFNTRRTAKVTSMDDTNDIGVVLVAVRAGEKSAREILFQVNNTMAHYKNSPMVPILSQISKMAYFLSPRLSLKAVDWFANKGTFGFSNYATLLSELTVDGCEVVNLYNAVKPYKMGVFFSVLSYGDYINLSACYKNGNMDDINYFKTCIERAYNELK